MITTQNPFTQDIIAQYHPMKPEGIIDIIEKSQDHFDHWRYTNMDQRIVVLDNLIKVFEKNTELYAHHITQEMGKPILQSRSEINKIIQMCHYYRDNSEEILADQIIPTHHQKSYISKKPLGIIFAIMPWNFPFWQVLRCAVPALMSGNSVILKHSENVTGCALIIETAFKEAGFGDLFNVILCDHEAAEAVIAHPYIAAIAFTGSARGGSQVASLAGKYLKKIILELGGSDPYIICEDADLELAANLSVKSRLLNNGQTCISAKRFIVMDKIYAEFTALLQEKIALYSIGDPMEEQCDLGPLATNKIRHSLHHQVIDSVKQGGICVMGGYIPESSDKYGGNGFFYPPTLLTGLKKGMAAYDQETFGPVFGLMRANDIKQAINIANDTAFGLGGAIFTKDTQKGVDIITNKLEIGVGAVNNMITSTPHLPFGGIKQSGFGRELSAFGMNEFVNIKSIMVS